MDSSSDSLSPVELLAEEFLDRQQRGENPTIDEYCGRHPELAEEIRDVFEGFLLIEDLKPGSHDVSETFSGDRRIDGKKLDRIGDYRIIREVGRGGMGVVFEAEQESLRRRVALKVLPRQIASDPKSLQRFQQEARAAARMHHTNIVPVFEVGDDEEHVFYAMQLIQGQGLDVVIDDLRRLRNEHSGLPTSKSDAAALAARSHANSIAASLVMGEFEQQDLVDEVRQAENSAPRADNGSEEYNATVIAETKLFDSGSTASAVLPGQSEISSAETDRGGYFVSVARIGHQTAGALAYAHARGIIHRDIKPSNLLLDTAGIVWVTDFGLAKTGDEALTHTGDILGTLRYMSPERFKGQCDVRADVYALGLTLYEMLVLKPAFSSPDRLKLIELVSKSEPPTPRSIDDRIPRDLETIILKSIDKDPRRRYQSADDLSDDLERFIQDEPIHARRISLVERCARWSRRNKSLAASLGALATVILVVAIGSTIAAGYFRNMNRTLEASEDRLTDAVRELEDNEKRLIESEAREKERADAMEELAVARDKAADEALATRYEVTLGAALEALTTPGRHPHGKDLLDGMIPRPGEEDRRGLEYRILDSLPDTSGGRILAHIRTSPRSVVCFSPDDSYIAVADASGDILILDAESGTVVKRLVGHTNRVTKLVWAASGSRLVSTGGNSVCVWDVESGLEQMRLPDSITFALSPDETRLATRTDDGLQVWDISNGELLRTFEADDQYSRFGIDMDWSVLNQIGFCSHGEVRLLDVETAESRVLTGTSGESESQYHINGVCFSPDGSQLAGNSMSPGGQPVFVWDLESSDKPRTLPALMGVMDIEWSHDGSRLATTSLVGSAVEIWEPATGERVRRLTGHSEAVGGCSWSHDDRRVVSTSRDGTVRLWEIDKEVAAPEFAGHDGLVRDLAWGPGSRYFATASTDGTVRIWDVRLPREAVFTFRGHDQSLAFGVDWHPSANRLVSCDSAGVVLVWEWDGENDARVIAELQASDSRVTSVVWSPDGTQVATAPGWSDEYGVRTYDALTGEKLLEFPLNGAYSVSWGRDGDGNPLLAAAGNEEVTVWNVETRQVVRTRSGANESFRYVALSPQGDRVAFSGSASGVAFGEDAGLDPILEILDLGTGVVHRLQGHQGEVMSISWTADGTRLLTAGMDGTAILWNADTGRQLVAFDAPDRVFLYAARFSPDQLRIAIAGAMPGIQVLDATPSYVEELAQELERGLTTRIETEPTARDLVLRGRVLAKQGRWDEAASDFQQAGSYGEDDGAPSSWFETTWWVAGPYAEALADPQPPERQTNPFQPIPAADETGERTAWSAAPFSTALDLGRLFDNQEHISAYVVTRIYATEPQEIGLLLGADEQVKVWSNGAEVYTRARESESVRDDEAVEIELDPGWNTLLVKVSNNTGAHGLFARLSEDARELAQAFDRNGQWSHALKWAEQALAENPDDIPLLFVRGRAALRTGERQTAEESFRLAIEAFDNKDLAYRKTAALYLEHAQSLSGAEQGAEAAASLEHARELYEQLVGSDVANERDTANLADVLLMTMSRPTWTVLEPLEMKSALGEEGATLTRLEDGSILASGNNPDGDRGDTYQLIIDSPLKTVTAVRLEALTDDSLPNRGPGRRPNSGNFAMSWFWWQEPNHSRLRFDAVDADYYNPRFPINYRRWNIGGGGESHTAVYRLATPVENETGLRFTMDMRFTSSPEYPSNNLGRFRISVTGDPNGFETAANRLDIQKITDAWERLAATYHVTGEEVALNALLERKPAAAAGIVALTVDAAGWTENIDPTAATEAIEAALRAHPNSDLLVSRILEICENASDPELRMAGFQTLIDHQRATVASPQQLADSLRRRGALYVRAGEWERAAADYAEAIKLDTTADSDERMKVPVIYAYLGNAKAHRDYCREMSDHFETLDADEDDNALDKALNALRVVLSMLLLEPESESDLQREDYPVRAFLGALEEGGLNDQPVELFQATRALWVCRFPHVGDPDEARQWVDQSGGLPRISSDAPLHLLQLTVHALIQARYGEPDEARALLNQAQENMENTHNMKWLDDGSLDGSTMLEGDLVNHFLLIPEILRREAERVLQAGGENQAADRNRADSRSQP